MVSEESMFSVTVNFVLALLMLTVQVAVGVRENEIPLLVFQLAESVRLTLTGVIPTAFEMGCPAYLAKSSPMAKIAPFELDRNAFRSLKVSKSFVTSIDSVVGVVLFVIDIHLLSFGSQRLRDHMIQLKVLITMAVSS
jgi:hypothetical protein